MARLDLTLEPLRRDQYRQVAEWEFGLQDGVDWDRYEREMNEPQWTHFGMYAGAEFVGCVSIEQTGRNMADFHVVTARRKVHRDALARMLLDVAAYLFSGGFTALTAHIPKERRAASRLALACGMWEYGHTPQLRLFILTKTRYDKWAEASHNR